MIHSLTTQARRSVAPVVLAAAALLGSSAQALTINATFVDVGDGAFNAASMAVVNQAIAFYENTFSDNVTVNIQFHNDHDFFGGSLAFRSTQSYAGAYRGALIADSSSADDATAVASLPSNLVFGTNLSVKSALGRAVGLNTPGGAIFYNDPNNGGLFCNFTGDGCIGLDLANTGASLIAVVEHEINEVLGLGSGLSGTSRGTEEPEDLFRFLNGARTYQANSSTTNGCGAGSSRAFFSVDGGATNLNEFNNCNNGGDYGDWITHNPSQVQDAFTDQQGVPSMTLSSTETRALDVIGWTMTTQTRTLPEPGTLGLLGLALLAAAASRRRRDPA